jgi:hypothetical protein
MSESAEEEAKTDASVAPPAKKLVGTPFRKGVSGNPSGRPRVEPRVRRYARRYDRKMCRVLAEIAQDPKLPASERRRAAMDLIAVGSGRPALVQEIANKGAPLLGVNIGIGAAMGGGPGGHPSPEMVYQWMVSGVIEATGDHPAFHPAIEQQPVSIVDNAETPEK